MQDAATENILQQQVSDIENEIRILNDTEDHGRFILARQQAMHRLTMHPGYYFVGDNVDMRTKVRHMTFAHQKKINICITIVHTKTEITWTTQDQRHSKSHLWSKFHVMRKRKSLRQILLS